MDVSSNDLVVSLVVGCLAAAGVWAYIDYAESKQEADRDERKYKNALENAAKRKEKIKGVLKAENKDVERKTDIGNLGIGVNKRAGTDVPIPGAGGRAFRG